MAEEKKFIDEKEYNQMNIKSIKVNGNEDNNVSIVGDLANKSISFTSKDFKEGTLKIDIEVNK